MPRDDVVIIGACPREGGEAAWSWRALCDLRRAQREAAKAARGTQLTLFELKDDRRPAAERTASGRYLQPDLLDRLR